MGVRTRNWIDSAQDRDYWRALMNAVLNLWLSYAMELENWRRTLGEAMTLNYSAVLIDWVGEEYTTETSHP